MASFKYFSGQQQFSVDNGDLTEKQMNMIRYGINCIVYQNLLFTPATIYLDPWYPNSYIWVATDEQTQLFDLGFIQLSCYSLELQLSINNDSLYKKNKLPRYIIIKDFNFQIPIIFQQEQQTIVSSQQNLGKFIEGKKPLEQFNLIQKLMNKRKKEMQNDGKQISAGFSRFIKLVRIKMQRQSVNLSKVAFIGNKISFAIQTVKKFLLKVLQIYNFESRHSLLQNILQKEKNIFLSLQQIMTTAKILYCHFYAKLLKAFIPKLQLSNKSLQYPLTQKIISSVMVRQKQTTQKLYTCFQTIMKLQSYQQNYIIPEYKINQSLPLTDYFCFSSHNTYLTGNQLTSDCKVTRYIEDLKKGIKCVQLDVHNDGTSEPIITHAIKGKGFCKPISFRSTIQAIDQYLQYHPNHYPIILSIQNHASKQNQDLMNNILVREFNKSIAKPKMSGDFYKLSELKGKIIVKTSCGRDKLLKLDTNKNINRKSIAQSTGKINIHQLSFNEHREPIDEIPHDKELQQLNYKTFIEKTNKMKRLKKIFNSKLDDNLFTPIQKIAQITCMFKAPKGIETKDVSGFQCTSMINNKITKVDKQKIINYTKSAWMRSYPEGTQINSCNYEFLELLARGVQIIALNTQTNDDYAIMMNSYFTAGRRGTLQKFGYLQKPEYLLSSYTEATKISTKRSYKFTFYTQLILEFKIYSIEAIVQNLNSSNILKSSLNRQQSCIKVQFKNLTSFNESFLIIFIKQREFVECIPLRFLEPTQSKKKNTFSRGKQYRTLVARDYQYEDTGIRIICEYECIQE